MSKPPAEVLRDRFYRFLHQRKDDGKVVDQLARLFRSRGWTVFAFGGTPRGVQDSGSIYRPRDLDLVFEDAHFEAFESAFEKDIVRRNNFGGLKLKITNIIIDAWPLSATWAFRNGFVQEATWENLPATTFLNVDGIIVEFAPKVLKRRKIYEVGFFDGWDSKTLDINLVANPFPAICVARTLTISRHFGFVLSPRLALYMHEMMVRFSLSAIENAQRRHYGHVKFDFSELRKIREKIDVYLSDNPLKPLALFPARLNQPDLFNSYKRSASWSATGLPANLKGLLKSLKAEINELLNENLIETGFPVAGDTKGEVDDVRGHLRNRRRRPKL